MLQPAQSLRVIDSSPTHYSMHPMEVPRRKAFNFAAERGPIAKQVLRMTQSQIVNYNGSYLSVLDMSRQSAEFKAIEARAKDSLRQLLNIPEDFSILFQQGGASLQHLAVCYNLLGPGRKQKATYFKGGPRSAGAINEAANLVENIQLVDQSGWGIQAGSSYFFFASNEEEEGKNFTK